MLRVSAISIVKLKAPSVSEYRISFLSFCFDLPDIGMQLHFAFQFRLNHSEFAEWLNKGNEMSNSIMLEMTISNNGPVEFDEFVFEINSELRNAVSNFDMNSYNAIVAEMAEFNLKPEFILDAPNSELPNRANDICDNGNFHIDNVNCEECMNDILNEVSENVANAVKEDSITILMNRIDAQFPDNDESELDESEMDESEMDSALLDF